MHIALYSVYITYVYSIHYNSELVCTTLHVSNDHVFRYANTIWSSFVLTICLQTPKQIWDRVNTIHMMSKFVKRKYINIKMYSFLMFMHIVRYMLNYIVYCIALCSVNIVKTVHL